MAQLPLFPLGTVLFPGQILPLRVFEPRYVALMSDLLEQPGQERCFGVVSLLRGNEVGTDSVPELARTGTAAVITHLRSGAGGPAGVMFAIRTRGARRFRLESFAADPTPYYVGTVTWLEDPAADPGELERAVDEATGAYQAYLQAAGGEAEALAGPPEHLAYELVSAISLPIADRQAVLDTDDPVARLRLVSRLLRRETALFGGQRWVPTERYTFGPPSQN